LTSYTDVSTSGSRFNAQASPLLSHVVRHAADDLPHPTKDNATLWDATKDTGDYFGITAQTVDEEYLAVRARTTNTADDIGVGVLGSGSDYTGALWVPATIHRLTLQHSLLAKVGGAEYESWVQCQYP
jgi:hypothetical protein